MTSSALIMSSSISVVASGSCFNAPVCVVTMGLWGEERRYSVEGPICELFCYLSIVPTLHAMDTLVLDSCPMGSHDPDAGCHQVAEYLGLSLCMPADAKRLVVGLEAGEAYVVVVTTPEDARVVRPALRAYPLRAVIAWRLAEVVISELLYLPIPVVIGLPDLVVWDSIISQPVDSVLRTEDSRICSQLALLEGQLLHSLVPPSPTS